MKLGEMNDMKEKPTCEVKGCNEKGLGLVQLSQGEYAVLCPKHYYEITVLKDEEQKAAIEAKLKEHGLELERKPHGNEKVPKM